MPTVTAATLTKQFGRWRDLAQREPVSITHHGRETLVMISAEEYRRLKALDDRRVYAAEELPDDLLAELAKPTPRYETDLDEAGQA